jgi:pimeloyl-ACP methyl ester carboxylesterase
MSDAVRGSGPPLVLIPGIQGRWEWMTPAIDALARRYTVMTFSLGDVEGPGWFDGWTARIDAILRQAGSRRAIIVGVSFGGLVAACYAARRPDRTAQLVLVSTPSPSWRLDRLLAACTRYPRLALPLFACRAMYRLAPEVFSAIPGTAARLRFCAGYAVRSLRFPVSPRWMAAVACEWQQTDLAAVVRGVRAPTLVITGDPHLDRVVPVASSREFLTLIAGARVVTLPGTGHIGLLSKPREFAAAVSAFVDTSAPARAAVGR